MAEQPIKGNEIIEDGALDNPIKELREYIELWEKFNNEAKKTAKTVKSASSKLSPNQAGSIKEAIAQEKLLSATIVEQEKVKRAKIQTEKQLITLENKKATQTAKSIKQRKDLKNAYKQESKELTSLVNSYQNLASRGRENGKVARGLLKEIDRLDKKLKGIDETVGRNYRNVGNYSSAWKGLKSTLLGGIGITTVVYGLQRLTGELMTNASELKGIEFAFDRLGQKGVDAFNKVKASTRGLLADSSIKQSLVEFDNFNISLAQTDKLFEFLAVRSAQTGVSIDKLKSSLVEGLSKESKLRIDNLGISTAKLNEELERTPDFVQAVANIAEEEVSRAGNILDEAGNSQQRWNTLLKNTKDQLSIFLIPVFERLFRVLTFIGNNFKNIAKVLGVGLSAWVSYRIAIKLTAKEIDGVKKTGIINFILNLAKSVKGASFSLKGMALGFKGVGTAIKSIPLASIISGITTIITTVVAFSGVLDDNTEDIKDNTDALKINNDEIERRSKLTTKQKSIDQQIESITELTDKQLLALRDNVENTKDEIEELSVTAVSTINEQLVAGKVNTVLERVSSDLEENNKRLRDAQAGAIELNQVELSTDQLKKRSEERAKIDKEREEKQKKAILENASLEERANFELRAKQLESIDKEIAKRKLSNKVVSDGGEDEETILTGLDDLRKKQSTAEKLLNDELVNTLGFENEKTELLREQLDILELQIKKYEFLRDEGGFDVNQGGISRQEVRGAGRIDSEDRITELQKIDTKEEEVIDNEINRAEQYAELSQSITDVATNQMNRRLELLDIENQAEQKKYEESLAREQQIIATRELQGAELEKSLTFEKKAQAEALVEQEKIAKRKQRIELITAGINTLNSAVQSGSANPASDTISQLTTVIGFLNSLPTFWEGTETTVGDSLGQKVSNGRDGVLIRADKDEIILNKEKSDRLSGMTTEEITRFALMGQNGIHSMGVKAMIAPVYDNRLNNELLEKNNSLLEQIARKPSSQFSLETLADVAKLMETKYTKNKVTTTTKRLGR